MPRWYFEGSAVFMETWMAGGIGRAQGAYDEMVFRAMVRDDVHFYSDLGLAWADWIVFEHEFQEANLARVREAPLTPIQRLTSNGLGSVSKSFVDEAGQQLIGGFYFPGVVSHLGALSLEDGSLRNLAEIQGPMKFKVTTPALDAATGKLYYCSDNLHLRDLMELDLATGSTRMLLEDARIGDLAFSRNDGSLLGLRHLNGYVTLVRMNPPFTDWNQVHTCPYGQVLSDPDISPDGQLLCATVEDIQDRQFLRLYRLEDLLLGTIQPIQEFSFGRAVPEGFVFSPDGQYLYGSSFYTGVSNIFRCGSIRNWRSVPRASC